MIVSRTPLRISLIGGGTDVPSFYEKHPGCVVSFAINKYVYIMVNDKFDGRFRVSYSKTENVDKISDIKHPLVHKLLSLSLQDKTHGRAHKVSKGLEIVSIADIPGEGSGLGSSSSFMVGLCNALNYHVFEETLAPWVLAEHAFHTEKAVAPNIGKQDHYAASYGGFNRYDFTSSGLRSFPVQSKLDWDTWHEHMLLLWTGTTRKSDDLLKAQKEGFDSGKTFEIGRTMELLAREFFHNLVDGKIKEASDNIHRGWHLKRRLAPGISNQWIDDWYAKAMNNGAWGGKLCGAGGGGFLFFFAPPDTHDRIVKATGLRKIDFNLDTEGSVIIKREGYGEF